MNQSAARKPAYPSAIRDLRFAISYFMHKIGLVDAVHAKLGGTKKTAEDVVDTIFDTIMATLGKGEEVAVSGFGSFIVKKRGARMGVNPRTGQKIQVAETVTPKFRAGKALKAAVK